jgi:nitronate monooxygenase
MLGTRLVASTECSFHPKLKDWLIQLTEKDTMCVHRAINNNERVIRTPFTEMILDMEQKGAPLEQILPLISGEKVRAAYETGDTSNAIITVGQAVGLIHDIRPVKDIIEGMVNEAAGIVARLDKIKES